MSIASSLEIKRNDRLKSIISLYLVALFRGITVTYFVTIFYLLKPNNNQHFQPN